MTGNRPEPSRRQAIARGLPLRVCAVMLLVAACVLWVMYARDMLLAPEQPARPPAVAQVEAEPEQPEGLLRSMVLIPGGSFLMGSTNNPTEQPVHRVAVDGFWMDRFEMTNKDFERFMPAHRRFRRGTSTNDADPVIVVTWEDATNYCAWRCRREGMPEGTYRLPTEAEWEYAARGGLEQKQYPWGDFLPVEFSVPVASYKAVSMSNEVCIAKLSPVGSYPPNGFGLYDMSGNVWEWCRDWYADNAYAARASGGGVVTNPVGPDLGIKRVWRGGAWLSKADLLRCASRGGLGPAQWLDTLGFRCVRVSAGPEPATRTGPPR